MQICEHQPLSFHAVMKWTLHSVKHYIVCFWIQQYVCMFFITLPLNQFLVLVSSRDLHFETQDQSQDNDTESGDQDLAQGYMTKSFRKWTWVLWRLEILVSRYTRLVSTLCFQMVVYKDFILLIITQLTMEQMAAKAFAKW